MIFCVGRIENGEMEITVNLRVLEKMAAYHSRQEKGQETVNRKWCGVLRRLISQNRCRDMKWSAACCTWCEEF